MMRTQTKIAITGGIGAGKSVVSRVLRTLGYPVYDCDTEAKRLMHSDDSLRSALISEFGDAIYDNGGELRRQALADIVFADRNRLSRLNTLVHGAVLTDIVRWASQQKCDKIFVESAIVFESGLDKIVDEIWVVDAPVDIRIRRVMGRNPEMTESQIRARIAAQSASISSSELTVSDIVNDGVTPVLPRVLSLLGL